MRRIAWMMFVALLVLGGSASAQTLVFAESGLPVTLDTGQDGNSLTVQYQITEPLVFFSPGGVQLEPGLATSWQPNADATVWTFHLRQGVTFQDGTPFNAEAVKFNFDRWNDRSNPYAYPDQKSFVSWANIFGGFHGEDGALLDSVEVVDDATVRFHLTASVGFFPAIVASSYFGMHSPTAVKKAGEAYGSPTAGAVGTGPFKFEAWDEGRQVSVVRNDAYWGEPAKVDRIVFLGIDKPGVRLAQLEAGTVDIAVNLSPDDLNVVRSTAGIKQASAKADLSLGYLGIHEANPPLNDVRVRQAIAYALDKQSIVSAFYGDLGSVAAEFIPPGLMGRADLDAYPYDPEKAKQLLAEAGYPDGFDTQLWYMPVSRPYYPSPKDIAEAIAGQLAAVGIHAQLNTEEWGIYLKDYKLGKLPIYMLGWNADYADPNNFIYTFFGPSQTDSRFGWDDAQAKQVVQLLSDAQSAGAVSQRQSLYQQASRIIHDQVPALPVVYPRSLNATRDNIEGFLPNPLGTVVSLAGVVKH